MIRYALTCADNHSFESWFQSAEAYEKLAFAGMVSCAHCGSVDVRKSVMAPRIGKSTKAPRPLSTPDTPAEKEISELRKKIEENSDYVGDNFASEARAIHDGDAPERSIYGEAKLEDARALVEDGVPVAPLPFMPPRKAN